MYHSEELYQQAKSHFNDPVLIGDKVGRLIGYAEDAFDCYFIIKFIGGKIIWHTCVGGCYWLNCLKGQGYIKSNNGEDWDDFYRVDSLLQFNGSPISDEFALKIDHDDEDI